jgi:Flp pilus assembly protein TadD
MLLNGWIAQFLKILTISAVAALLHACATTNAAQTDPGNPFSEFSTEQILEAGDKAYRLGEYDRAIFIYMQALEIEKTADNWYRAGITKLKLDDKEFAWSAFGAALKLDADHVLTHEDLGLLYVSSGQTEQAKFHLTRVTELDSTRWRAWNALGVIADVETRYADAVGYYKAALEHHPESPTLMNNIGYSYYLAGNLQKATNWFDAAIQAQPGFELALRNLGLLYARQGWYAEAVDTFVQVVKRPKALNDVGYIAMRNGDYDDAALLLTEAVHLSPTYYVTAYENLDTLAELRKQQGQSEPQEPLADNISEVMFPEDHETRTLKVMPQALNVRSAPERESDIIDYLKTGESVQIILVKESWAFISYRPAGVTRDLTGWVKSRYLKDPAAGSPTPIMEEAVGNMPVGMRLEDVAATPAAEDTSLAAMPADDFASKVAGQE